MSECTWKKLLCGHVFRRGRFLGGDFILRRHQWDSNPRPKSYESDTLTTRPLTPTHLHRVANVSPHNDFPLREGAWPHGSPFGNDTAILFLANRINAYWYFDAQASMCIYASARINNSLKYLTSLCDLNLDLLRDRLKMQDLWQLQTKSQGWTMADL